MTVSYGSNVAQTSFIGILRLLLRWKGSAWKNASIELLIWSLLYAVVSIIYRTDWFLTEYQKDVFENIKYELKERRLHAHVTLVFFLGFFAKTAATRWLNIMENMGYIERHAHIIGSYVQGDDEHARLMRRAMVRWMCLAQVLVFRDLSVRTRKRYPDMESIIKAGYMLDHEREKYESIQLDYDKYWVPVNWTYILVFEARRRSMITSDIMCHKVCDEIKVFRTNLQYLCNFDWVPIPLVYPQVIQLVVYFYFALCLISRQPIIRNCDPLTSISTENITEELRSFNSTVLSTITPTLPNVDDRVKCDFDTYIPWMTMIQFLFYVGWTKSAIALLNPLGTGDDGFECNFLLEKNLKVCLDIVDTTHGVHPKIVPDQFWSRHSVDALYPDKSTATAVHPLIGSAVASVSEEISEPQMFKRNKTSEDGSVHHKWRNSFNIAHLRRKKTSHTNSEIGRRMSHVLSLDALIQRQPVCGGISRLMRSKSECPTVRLDSVISEENDVSQHSELNEKLRTNQTNTLRAENLRAAVETPDSCALRPDKNEILLGIDKLLHAEGSSC